MGRFVSPDIKTMIVYGGTFDPFHCGHEAICNAILRHAFVDQLRLIPCHVPALKAQATASGSQRLRMLKHWQKQQADARLAVDSIELERAGPSFTLETVIELQAQYPNTQVILAMGADAWQSLPRWHGYSGLKDRINVWVFTRLGQPELALLPGWTRVDDSAEFSISDNGHYFIDHTVQLDISSTFLRTGPQTLKEQVPGSIFNYILEHDLYRDAYQNV
jgi:nicotinate-nucleotide adenylyltransferase